MYSKDSSQNMIREWKSKTKNKEQKERGGIATQKK